MTDQPEPKYYVVKAETMAELKEYFAGTQYGTDAINRVKAAALPDAIVLRGQDTFTAGAIDRYVENVLDAARSAKDPVIRERLQNLADRMHDAAAAADAVATTKKVPD